MSIQDDNESEFSRDVIRRIGPRGEKMDEVEKGGVEAFRYSNIASASVILIVKSTSESFGGRYQMGREDNTARSI